MKTDFKLGVIFILLIVNLVLLLFIGFKSTGFSVSENNIYSYDFIKEDKIHSNFTGVFFEIGNATFSRFEDSGSMGSWLGEDATSVEFKPRTEEDVHIGDVISFKQEGIFIVHRVIEKGIDSEGVYFVTRGDNNFLSDEKIRFSDIEGVLVAVIY
ncbi:MAG: hypothetical protein AABW50_01435 [Nanoarchaeota archaeon]